MYVTDILSCVFCTVEGSLLTDVGLSFFEKFVEFHAIMLRVSIVMCYSEVHASQRIT